ncbi:BTAD domain-containing putative transcriptional regulator [Streptomyces stramineus]|uniref:Bacterial transcriptional activator domain-containing protein n=1 Tax=Streptomyces stramineus TaxID=173861 RepID=A0ABP3JHI6_9ACTN
MPENARHPEDDTASAGFHLLLLPAFELSRHGRRLRMPAGAQRLLAFLALSDRPQHRGVVAGRLWADLPGDRSAAALRTTLWQVRRAVPDLVASHGPQLGLCPSVAVDLHESVRWIRLLEAGERPGECRLAALGHDLLPEWLDEWVVVERERYRQIRLHALETLCRRLTEVRDHASAIEAGLSAVSADPLRETAQRVLIEAHIAEGNLSEAVRQYRSYARLLRLELGVEPTAPLAALLPDAAHTYRVGTAASRP